MKGKRMDKRWSVAAGCLMVGLAGCGTMNKEPPPKPFTGTRWAVVLELPLPGEPPNFRFGDGRIEGFAGCNQVTGRFVQDTVGARAIAIGRLEVGRRTCDTSARAAEANVIAVLQSVSSYSITADLMTMTGSGGSLRFKALPPEARY
jgi:heat shock protein HslJ